jgi:probable phosphoglycerate mutase
VELLLIRHALPVRDENVDGPADPALAPAGRRQAEALAAWLADEPIDAIYTSPLRRAVETAVPLAEATGLGTVVDEDLAEYDRHANAYIPIEEARAEGLFDPSQGYAWGFEEVDDPAAWFTAVVTAMERVVEAHPGQTVAVVAHGGVVNAYLAHVLGIGARLFFEPAYTSISRVLAARTGEREIRSVNETAHVRGLLPARR